MPKCQIEFFKTASILKCLSVTPNMFNFCRLRLNALYDVLNTNYLDSPLGFICKNAPGLTSLQKTSLHQIEPLKMRLNRRITSLLEVTNFDTFYPFSHLRKSDFWKPQILINHLTSSSSSAFLCECNYCENALYKAYW